MKDEIEEVKKAFVKSFEKFIRTSNDIPAIKSEVSLATQKCLHNLNAQIHGGEVIACGTMWERFSFKQKCKWYIVNKLIPSIGIKARAQFDAARLAWYDNQDPEDEDFYPYTIDSLFELNPKGVIQTDVSMRLNEPVEFIGISIKATIENGEVKCE